MFVLINKAPTTQIIDQLTAIKLLPAGELKGKLEDLKDGKTLVHAAIERGDPTVLRLLIILFQIGKLKFDRPDKQGDTPLHYSARQSNMELTSILLANDCSMTDKNKDQKTASDLSTDVKMTALLSTRLSWHKSTTKFKFYKVATLISNCHPEIAPAVGQDKVLFIGGTGVGKSTLLNYLNGTRYTTGFGLADKPYADAIGGTPEVARVGHTMTSQTLYPQVIKREGLNSAYCDLAGLEDSRGLEEKMCAASGVQLLSGLQGNIKGIMFVLDIPGFRSLKGQAFKNTAITLARMVQNNHELMKSVYFAITKAPKSPKRHCLDTSKITITQDNIIETFVDPLLDAIGETSDPEELDLKFMLEQMKANKNNIIIPDISDDGTTRQDIEKRLGSLSAQPASKYNFKQHDESQKTLYKYLSSVAADYLEWKQQLNVTLPKQHQDATKNIQELDAKLKDNAGELKIINEKITSNEACIKTLEKQLNDFRNKKDAFNCKYNTQPTPCKSCEEIETKAALTSADTLAKINQETEVLKQQRRGLEKSKLELGQKFSTQQQILASIKEKTEKIAAQLSVNQQHFSVVASLARSLHHEEKNVVEFCKVLAINEPSQNRTRAKFTMT